VRAPGRRAAGLRNALLEHCYDPAAGLFRALDRTVRQTSNRQLIRLTRNINESEFAAAIVAAFRSLIGRPGTRRRMAR